MAEIKGGFMHRFKGKLTSIFIMQSLIALMVGLLIVAFYTPALFAYNSRIVDTQGNIGQYTSMALDSSQKPYISYYDATRADLKFASLDSSGFWRTEKVDELGNVGMFSSLSVDTSGTPHISYYDQFNGDLRYAKKDSSGWHLYEVDTEDDVGKFTSIAIDSANNPHISYQDATNNDLKYAYKNAGAWIVEKVDQEGNIGTYTSLALDSSGRPHISYYDAENKDLKYAYRDANGVWHSETVDSIGNVGLHTSIAIDSSGMPHISYYDTTNGRLKYAHRPSSTWQVRTVDSNGSVGEYTSIAIDSSKRPHISYYDGTNGDLRHAHKHDNGTWQVTTIDNPGNVGSHSSIKLSNSNIPHISYFDSTNGDLKYICLDVPMIINTNPAAGETHVPERKTITVTFNKPIVASSDFGKIALKKGDTALAAITTISNDGKTLIINSANDFESNTSYTIYIPAGAIRDSSGNALLASYTFSFSIQPDAPPAVISTDPANGSIGFQVNKNITVTFNKSINTGTNNTGLANITFVNASGSAISSNKGLVNNQLVITPQSNLSYNTRYTITIPDNTIKDIKGSNMPQYTFSFTTQPEPDKTPPTASSTDPANGSTGISISKTITVTFSENIQAGSAYANVAIAKTGGSGISISKSISDKVLTINPTSNLDYGINYTVTIPASAIKDMSDNALAASYSFNFTTQAYSSASVPANLKTTSTNPNIILAWDASTGAVKYNIYRKEGSSTFTKINIDAVTSNQYTDATAQQGKTYTYYVTAIDSSSRESVKSNEISAGLTVVRSEVIFRDIQANAWYKTYLDKLIELKAISGYSDGTFKPNNRITRGELVKVLSVALNWQMKKQVDVVFLDAPPNMWVYPYVQKAIANGAMGGYANSTFQPNRYITRAELAKVIASSLDLYATGTSSFKDANQSWAKDYIIACAQAGIIKGYNNGTFNPGGTATRAEAVAMVYRMLSFKK